MHSDTAEIRNYSIKIESLLILRYVDHGAVVSRVYKVLQCHGDELFKDKADKITRIRRLADIHPELKPIADSMKTLGNRCRAG